MTSLSIASRTKRFAVAAAALLAAACGTTPLIGVYPQVLYQEHNTLYYPEAVALFGAAGGPTEIYGAPAGGATPEEITEVLRLPHFVASRRLSPAAPTDAHKGLRLVLIITPQSTIRADDACKGQGVGGESGAQMRVKGVFCRGGRAMSEALVFAKGAPGVGDPAFAATVNQLITTIMPPSDPNRDQQQRPRRAGP